MVTFPAEPCSHGRLGMKGALFGQRVRNEFGTGIQSISVATSQTGTHDSDVQGSPEDMHPEGECRRQNSSRRPLPNYILDAALT